MTGLDRYLLGELVTELPTCQHSQFWRDKGKRAFDLFVCLGMLILFSPIMIFCMLWIKLRDGGPVFYSQFRVGQDGKEFKIYKLRTMKPDAEKATGVIAARADDDRILHGCHWMRKMHMDELPQLLNVIKGDMSIVGPRPERRALMQHYLETLPDFDIRLSVKPGLTGLAQITSGYTDDVNGAREKLIWDKTYINNMTLKTDVRIVLATLPCLWDELAR